MSLFSKVGDEGVARDRLSFNMPLFHADTPKLRNKLADLYTDETRWQLANGYFDAITAVKTEYLYTCAYHFFSKQTSMTANRVFNFIIDKVPTKHFAAYTDYDLNDYAWLGIGHGEWFRLNRFLVIETL